MLQCDGATVIYAWNCVAYHGCNELERKGRKDSPGSRVRKEIKCGWYVGMLRVSDRDECIPTNVGHDKDEEDAH